MSTLFRKLSEHENELKKLEASEGNAKWSTVKIIPVKTLQRIKRCDCLLNVIINIWENGLKHYD